MKDTVIIIDKDGNEILLPRIFGFNAKWTDVNFIASRNEDNTYLLQWVGSEPMFKMREEKFVHNYFKNGSYKLRKV